MRKKVKRSILTIALLATGCTVANAQFFDFRGDVHTSEYDGLPIYLIKTDVVYRDKAVRVDSCTVKDGKYSFHMAAPERPYVAVVALPEKDNHYVYGLPEITCIVEDGKVEADCHGFSYVLRGGKLNQSYDDTYLIYDRQVKAETERMMKERQAAEAKQPYADAENDAYSAKLKALYDGIRPRLRQFVAQNITNDVGAHLFLTYPDSYWPADFRQSMRQQVDSTYLRLAEARDKAEQDAVDYAVKARQETKAGNPYRDFQSATTDGTAVRFSDYVEKGKVTLLDFWASWCGPCIQEATDLKQLYASYHEKGFNIVSVSLDSNREKWLAAIKKYDLPWTHLSSVKGFKDPAAIEYGVSAIPFIVLIDQQGNIALQNMHGPVLHAKIKELMEF